MAPSQRSTARFFAAFLQWNEYCQRPCSSSFLSHRNRKSVRFNASDSTRQYHATRDLLQQIQPEAQSQDKESKSPYELNQHASGANAVTTGVGSSINSKTEGPAPTQTFGDKQEQTIETDGLSEDKKLKESFRRLFRNVPNPVVIATVRSSDPDTGRLVPMGITLSSLTSVTLNPPTVSFNIKEPSQTLDAIRAANGLFRIHFLTADPEGAFAVKLFTEGNNPTAYDLRTKSLNLFIPSTSEDDGATASLATQILTTSTRAAMECTVTHEFPVVDHVIVAARVDNLERKSSKRSMLTYVDGEYVRSQGIITVQDKPKVARQPVDGFSVFDFALFPGDQERRKYVEHLKRLLREHPIDLDDVKPFKQFELTLPYHPSRLGIDLSVVIANVKREMGLKFKLHPDKRGVPSLYDFYGRLSPSAREEIMNRAVRLVKEDKKNLDMKYGVFLQHLGVDSSPKDLLPSDIMTSLRAQGLVSEFEAGSKSHGPRSMVDYHLKIMEQVEHRVREYLGTLDYDKALKISFHRIMEELGENGYAVTPLRNCRDRLISETHPEQLGRTKIDIKGHVNQEEIRLVLSRLVFFLRIEHPDNFRKRFNIPRHEILRLIGVHPTITGMDIEFVFSKIHHLFSSTSNIVDFSEAIDKMLEPIFENKISWDEFERRVASLVKKNPRRAMTFRKQDPLAAMGLHWKAMVTISTPTVTSDILLFESEILSTMIAKELKAHFGKGTEEEDKLIAKFLKDKHGFDILAPTNNEQGSAEADQNTDALQDTFDQKSNPAPRIRFVDNQNTSSTTKQGSNMAEVEKTQDIAAQETKTSSNV